MTHGKNAILPVPAVDHPNGGILFGIERKNQKPFAAVEDLFPPSVRKDQIDIGSGAFTNLLFKLCILLEISFDPFRYIGNPENSFDGTFTAVSDESSMSWWLLMR